MMAVLLFAKAPRAGAVKTRLASQVGEAAALAAYREIGAGDLLQEDFKLFCPVFL